MKTFLASAPSNIALIKYMGKLEGQGNRPTNTSISYTIDHLKTFVQLEQTTDEDGWEPLQSVKGEELAPFELSQKGATRFLTHLSMLKSHLGYKGHFIVRSANNFPSDCGLASSASSFAALTKVAFEAMSEGRALPSAGEMASWSQKGSGSSCRSFFAPWAIWNENGASEITELSWLRDLGHQVVVVESAKKEVSSSDAHQRVMTSLLMKGRVERAETRARDLVAALKNENWSDAFEITWAEFSDMHALFETSRPSFSYMTPKSLEVLDVIQGHWKKHGDGPLATMDAGANVHLFYRSDAQTTARALAEKFSVSSQVLGLV